MIRTDNDFLVGSDGRSLSPLMHPRCTTRQQAFRLAAWLEVMAMMLPEEPEGGTYEEIRQAIMET